MEEKLKELEFEQNDSETLSYHKKYIMSGFILQLVLFGNQWKAYIEVRDIIISLPNEIDVNWIIGFDAENLQF